MNARPDMRQPSQEMMDIFDEVVAEGNRKAPAISPEEFNRLIAGVDSLPQAEKEETRRAFAKLLSGLQPKRPLLPGVKKVTFHAYVTKDHHWPSEAKLALECLGVKDYTCHETGDDMLKNAAEGATRSSGIHVTVSGVDSHDIVVEGKDNLVKLAQAGVIFPGSDGLRRQRESQDHAR